MVQTDEERKAKKKAVENRLEKKTIDKRHTMTFADTVGSHLKIKKDKEKKSSNDDIEPTMTFADTVGSQLKRKISSEDIGNIENMTDKEAEDLVGKLFELKGYDVKIGVMSKDGKNKRSQDGGIDVRAEKENKKIGIQVKHWKKNVGFDDAAKTSGVSKGFTKMILISTMAGFSKEALEHSRKNSKLRLWDSKKFKKELEQHSYSYEK